MVCRRVRRVRLVDDDVHLQAGRPADAASSVVDPMRNKTVLAIQEHLGGTPAPDSAEALAVNSTTTVLIIIADMPPPVPHAWSHHPHSEAGSSLISTCPHMWFGMLRRQNFNCADLGTNFARVGGGKPGALTSLRAFRKAVRAAS